MPMPTRSSASPSTSTTPSPSGASRHLACVRCLTYACASTSASTAYSDDRWLTACYQLTPRLQRLGRDMTLLDLGTCTDTEAIAVT